MAAIGLPKSWGNLDTPPAFSRCGHAATEPRRRTLSNGTVQLVIQCLDCGSQVRPIRRGETDLRAAAERNLPFDPDIAAARREARKAEHDDWRARQAQRAAQVQEDWWAGYNAYLGSLAWRERRALRLMRDQWICQARLPGCDERATEVHHLTYDHTGNEPLWDLQSVCTSCHEQITAMDRER